jgi:hypothetical protein
MLCVALHLHKIADAEQVLKGFPANFLVNLTLHIRIESQQFHNLLKIKMSPPFRKSRSPKPNSQKDIPA